MTEFAVITLENEMDLTLAYKKSIRTAELLGLTISTQTAFATGVSEVCREVIDKAIDGVARIGVTPEDNRFFLTAMISCKNDDYFSINNDGFEYARKLVPTLETSSTKDKINILLKLGIPRATRIDRKKLLLAKKSMDEEGPISAYEEVKLKNAELNQLSQQHELALVHANYLNQQKNEFLSVASHELNSPLTVLRSLTQLTLRMDTGENEKLKSFLKKIDVQSAKLVTLIQQLMDVSKIEHSQMIYNREKTDMNNFLHTTLDAVNHIIPAHQLIIELGEDCEVLIDRLRIEQVISNLIGNAAKYSAQGSIIHVKTIADSDGITAYITDEGIGMSANTINNVFTKFYRSESVAKKYSGLGMGLYIASRIIADHNGSIDVVSQEGKGSTFSFKLPCVAEA